MTEKRSIAAFCDVRGDRSRLHSTKDNEFLGNEKGHRSQSRAFVHHGHSKRLVGVKRYMIVIYWKIFVDL